MSKYGQFVEDCIAWDNGSQKNVPKPLSPFGDVPKDDNELSIPAEDSDDDAGTSVVISMCLMMTTMLGLVLV